MKKLYALAAPFVAVAAFMALPALASAASPEWTINGSPISHPTYVTSSSEEAVLVTANNELVCGKESSKGHLLPAGALPFSTTGQDTAYITFSECGFVAGTLADEGCSVVGGEIKTTPTYSALGEEGPFVVDGFFPQSGELFATVDLTGSGCTPTSVTAEGNGTEEPLAAVVNGEQLTFGGNHPLLFDDEPVEEFFMEAEQKSPSGAIDVN